MRTRNRDLKLRAGLTLPSSYYVFPPVSGIPVYRPLIGFDKEDVIRIARQIGTFEHSISPASGCKAVPKGPSTSAKLEKIREIEEALEANELLAGISHGLSSNHMKG